jgi:hypothetical protein
MMAADAVVIDMSDLKDLEPLSKRLNAASDELHQALQTIQERLNALAIGLEVWVEDERLSESDWSDILNDDDEPTGAREYTTEELGYGRFGDGWSLLVRDRRHVESRNEYGIMTITDYDDGLTPLLRAPRAVRVAAVTVIPKLIEALEAEAKNVIERVQQAKKIADSLK